MIKFFQVIFANLLTLGEIINIILLPVRLSIINFQFIIIKYLPIFQFSNSKYEVIFAQIGIKEVTKMEDKKLGRHILAEFYNCNPEILKDTESIEKYMIEAAKRAKATVVKSIFHTFNPYGVSGVVVIQESHLSIHTWPEYSYAAIDLFTCGKEVNPWIAFEYLKKKLKAEKCETMEVDRGIVEKIYNYSNGKYDNIVYKQKIV